MELLILKKPVLCLCMQIAQRKLKFCRGFGEQHPEFYSFQNCQSLSRCICMLFILLHLSCCLLNSGFDSRRKDHLVFPRILICDDKSIFAECWCLFCPGISQYYCKTYCHHALLWWMTKVAAILFKGKQETYKKLLKREWENNVQFQVAWQSDLLKLSTYLAANRSEKTSHPYLNSWSRNYADRPFIWGDETAVS